MSIVLISIFFSASAFFAAVYMGNSFIEAQITEHRLNQLKEGAGGKSFKRSALLKSRFGFSFSKIFNFKSAANFRRTTTYISGWLMMNALVFFIEGVSLIQKIMLASLLSFIMFRIVRILAIKTRHASLRKELPGTLDLIVICLEAGLGINAAFLRVSNEMPNTILGGELRQTLNEISAGIPLDTALRNLATRTAIPEIKGVVVAVLQSQKMGTALGATFRVQSESLRETYKLKMKEQIMKIPIKILFPLVLFILPAIFVVILGPAMMSIVGELSTQ